MPNWCANSLIISADKDKLNELNAKLDECQGKNFFDIFVPNSEEAGRGDDWYAYNQETYGCKWNCDASDWELISVNELRITFDSPWGPPIALYDKIIEDDLSVSAEYFEPGMAFVGSYNNGEEWLYEYGQYDSLEELYEEVPAELIESWGIDQMFLDRLEEENE